jgi:hypothetical protein
MRSTNSTAVEAATETYAERWRQLVCGIFCMVMIANLQYGWTLFVHPIDQKFHWGTTAILCLCGGYEFDRRCTRTFRSHANAAANYDSCLIRRSRVRSWLARRVLERRELVFNAPTNRRIRSLLADSVAKVLLR